MYGATHATWVEMWQSGIPTVRLQQPPVGGGWTHTFGSQVPPEVQCGVPSPWHADSIVTVQWPSAQQQAPFGGGWTHRFGEQVPPAVQCGAPSPRHAVSVVTVQ